MNGGAAQFGGAIDDLRYRHIAAGDFDEASDLYDRADIGALDRALKNAGRGCCLCACAVGSGEKIVSFLGQRDVFSKAFDAQPPALTKIGRDRSIRADANLGFIGSECDGPAIA